MGGYDRQILTEASTLLNLQREIQGKVPYQLRLMLRLFFGIWREKKVWSMAYSVFDPSAMVVRQSHCFMRMTSHTAITNFKKARRLKCYQETKPGRTRERTSEGMPGLL